MEKTVKHRQPAFVKVAEVKRCGRWATQHSAGIGRYTHWGQMHDWQFVACQTQNTHPVQRSATVASYDNCCVRFNWPNSLPHCLHFPPVAIFMPHACAGNGRFTVMLPGWFEHSPSAAAQAWLAGWPS